MRRQHWNALLAAALLSPGTAALAADLTLTVNNSGNVGDQTPGDGACATAGGQCTLRAAIQEVNAFANGPDTLHKIQFSVTNVQLDASGLPTLDKPTVIDGTFGAPRVEINGNGIGTCFTLNSPSGDASGSPGLP